MWWSGVGRGCRVVHPLRVVAAAGSARCRAAVLGPGRPRTLLPPGAQCRRRRRRLLPHRD